MRWTPLLALLFFPPVDDRRLPCVADTSICLHESERSLNQGGKPSIRIKGLEHILLMDFDTSAVKGRRVEEARLFLKPAGEIQLKTLGVSTVGAPWREGEACFLQAAPGKRDWAWPGSDFHAVTFGHGGSIWFARDIRDERDGWISVEVPPAILHALLEGNSHGLAVSDEKGQTRANNDIYAREQSASSPYLLVTRSSEGKAPTSGAKLYKNEPQPKSRDRTEEFLKGYSRPGSPRAGTFRVLYEGETDPKRESAGRLWDGKRISIVAARGEHVGFEIAVDVKTKISGKGWTVSRVLPVGTSFDPLVTADGEPGLYHVERYVGKDESPGEKKLSIRIGDADVPVSLRVYDVTLPDTLAFHLSLNTYTSPGGFLGDSDGSKEFLDLELAAHRLAHEHRATIAVVPYSHHGDIQWATAPEKKDGKITSWREWDERWAPYFDGRAFKGLPRDGVPLDHFYLPFHENWPIPITQAYAYRGKLEDHWRDATPIEDAFPDSYRKAFRASVADTARHLLDKKWTRTDFHVYLNNKNNYFKPDRDSSWWLLDEPAYRDDFLALRFFAQLFRDGAKEVRGAPMRFRIDLSRPQWRREHLDGLVGLDVIGVIYREYPQFVFGRGEDVWTYGTVPGPGAAPGDAPRAWILQAFLDGCDGIVPWQTLGRQDSWTQPEDTAILLPPRPGTPRLPHATLRLKMLRRGELDVELLRLLLAKKKWSRDELRGGLSAFLGLAGEFRQSSGEDAGRVDFSKLDPDRFEAFRRALLEALSVP